jgi:outer membrane lipoprotein-sorting protein
MPFRVSALLLIVLCSLGVRVAAAPGISAEDVIRRAEERFKTLRDYTCYVESETRLPNKNETETSTLMFWFKQPRLLKGKVIGGKGKGSEVALGPSGKVKAHKTGVLGFIKVTMDPDDKRLKGARGGGGFAELDFGSYYRLCRARAAKSGAKMTATRSGSGPYEVVLTYPEGGKQVRELYQFDPELMVLTRNQVWENGTLVDTTVFRDVKLNVGLDEKLFRL